ncbi:hypothetical protein DZI54_24000, partial [Salmonella enterica subsp. enterica serovar Alachua]|nr:hypothetical protein [Salmonella enterica subsp. enterica serovar Kentucky]ECT2879867.1 hypothetical protein [Salmonella enterica subsp. enterica serovar Alachua]ECV1568240.1 hypothetical protein [Salmonella enterica subsp. enterica serovar Kentucky]
RIFYTSHYILGQFTSPGSISSYWYCSKKRKTSLNITPSAQAYSCIQQVRKNARPWNKASHIKFRL